MDTRSNRKSMFEPVITRRVSPPIAQTNTHIIERVSLIILINRNIDLIVNNFRF